MSVISGYDKYKRYQKVSDDSYKLISHWTSSNTVHFDDGSTAEEKVEKINASINEVNNSINDVDTRINNTINELASNVAYIDNNNEELGVVSTVLTTQNIADNVNSSSKEMVLSAKQGKMINERISNIIAHSNETDGNTELLDVRVGANGTTYSSAGDAIRSQVNNLSSEIVENGNRLDELKKVNHQYVEQSNLTYRKYWSNTLYPIDNAGCSTTALLGLKAGHYYWNDLYSDHTYVKNSNDGTITKLTALGVASGANVSGDVVIDYPFDIYISYSGNENTDALKKAMFCDGEVPAIYRVGEYGNMENGITHFPVRVGYSEERDFINITSAISAIVAKGNSSDSYIYDVYIEDGEYNEKNITLPPYVNLIGMSGIRENCKIIGYNAPNVSDYNIENTSTINVSGSNKLKNLTITGQNVRYPIHSESSNAVKDWVQILDNCHVEHKGNQEVIDYRSTNNLDYNSVWKTCYAWGEGVSSGAYAEFNNCCFKSVNQAWYVHEAENMEKPYLHKLRNCVIETSGTWAVQVANERYSGQKNTVIIENCLINGGMIITGTYENNVLVSGCGDIPLMITDNTAIFDEKHFPIFTDFMHKYKFNGNQTLTGGEFVAFDSTGRNVVLATSETRKEMIVGYVVGGVDSDGFVNVVSMKYYPATFGVANGGLVGIGANGKATKHTGGTEIGIAQQSWIRLF